MQFIDRNLSSMDEEQQSVVKQIIGRKSAILDQYSKVTQRKINASKIRIHGDFHLGQVLYTGKDHVIIDFEGEPSRPPSERRIKYSSFRDIAGMIRSFHYAGYSALFRHATVRPEDKEYLQQWVEPWYNYVSGIYLTSYLNTVREARFIPENTEDIQILLNAFLLDKAVYELGYEMNNRPDWVIIPANGIKKVLERVETY